MPDEALPEIEIFRAGRQVATDGTVVDVSHADLAAIAAAYDPALGEAPHVIGHPQLNAPAFGWVSKLEARDGVLFAASQQLDPAFTNAVNKGRFKKRSASFFGANTPGNPKPGAMYLRHVGWLGAAVPAVTGLRDVQFADGGEGVVEFAMALSRPWIFRTIADAFSRIRDTFIERDGAEAAEKVLPRWMVDEVAAAANEPEPATHFSAPPAPSTETVMSDPTKPVDFAAREAELTTRTQNIEARETAIREREAKARRDGVIEFAAGLVKEGRLLPKHQAPIVELLASLEGADKPQTLNFAAADGTQSSLGAAQVLRNFLSEQPKHVDFAERGAGEALEGAVDFAAPVGTQVNRDRLGVHQKALAYQAAHQGTSYIDAVRAVGG